MRERTLNKIHKDYMNNLTYSELSRKYHKTKGQIHYIIIKNGWTRPRNKGHKNAIGNKGGGAPFLNQNAYFTGVYNRIFFNEAERLQALYISMKNSKKEYTEEQIKNKMREEHKKYQDFLKWKEVNQIWKK